MPPKKSPLKIHLEKWAFGCGSGLCKRANKICHVRGSVPCDIVFVGEAPGDSENVCGRPFVGPAGVHLQRYVIERAIPHTKVGYERKPTTIKYALMNLVGCLPSDETGSKKGPPEPEEIRACAPRLLELLTLCHPKLIVCVGKEAEEAMDPWMKSSVFLVNPLGKPLSKIPRITILHPAFILRLNIANQGLEFQRCALNVEQAIEEYVLGDSKPPVTPEPPDEFDGSTYLDDPNDPIPF